MASGYGDLAPELYALDEDALALWADSDARRRALEDVLSAWEAEAPHLQAAVDRIDRAVVAGLAALGLPRGLVREVRIEDSGNRWSGRKLPDCTILLDGVVMRHNLRIFKRPDTIFRTWVHESIHARQPYAASAAREYERFPGYDEGLAEGLARLVTREKAAMTVVTFGYDSYVAAYRALATVLGSDAEQVWRALWRHPAGKVRAAFLDSIDELRHSQAGGALKHAQRARLQSLADHLFQPGQSRSRPDESVITRLWEVALQ